MRPIPFILSAALLSACATTPEAPTGPPDFTAVPTQTSPRARLYADCIGQAVSTSDYAAAHDGDSSLVLFTCTGAPARVFYDGLAARSAAVGSEVHANGRTYRSTNAVQRDLYGVDYCSTDGSAYQCVITLNAGEFLTESAE